MKTVLLGGAVLAMAGVIASGTEAKSAEKRIRMGPSVDMPEKFGSGNFGHGDGGPRSAPRSASDEIHLKPEATLDNGLTMGAHIDLKGGGDLDQVEERWIYLLGGWGQLRIGDSEDARELKSTASTPPIKRPGAIRRFFTFDNSGPGQVVSTVSTTRNVENNAAMLTYSTPSFRGFQFAVSYAPGGQEDHVRLRAANIDTCPWTEDAFSMGADYLGELGDVSLRAGGGYSEGTPACEESEGDKPRLWAAGINVSYANLTVGGSIMFANEILADPTSGGVVEHNTELELGVAYVSNPLSIEIGWHHGAYDRGGLGTDTLEQARIGASYALDAGISLDAMVGYANYNCETCNDSKVWQTVIGAAIVF